MPLPRFRLRTLMIAVAVIAAISTAERLRHLRQLYRDRAEWHSTLEALHRASLVLHEPILMPVAPDGSDAARVGERNRREIEQEARSRREAEQLVRYHSALKRQYERAAARPWLPVPSDPPEPE